MTHTDLGTCELFVSELRRSNLIERGQLEHLLEDFLRRNPQSDANALAEHLVRQGTLTRFQAERVMSGKTQGLVLGAYVLTDSIGSGSMGSVYRAISKNDQKVYAVKVLPRRSMWNVRLARRQVRAFGQFSHPGVVPFVDVGTSGGLHYLVWNYVEGESLEAMVQRLGKLDPATAAQIGLQIAAGLNLAHSNGLFHGLLKPSNVMLSRGGQVRILDFGIGSLLAENEGESLVDTMSTSNTLTSGLDCASPESIMEPTNRTPAGDQYSLGCVIYFCLSGQYPFPEGSAVEKMMAHQFKQCTPIAQLVPGTPPQLAAVLDRLMQKKPEDRYAGVDGVVDALTPLAPAHATALMTGAPAQSLTQTPTQTVTRSGFATPGSRVPGGSTVSGGSSVPGGSSPGGSWLTTSSPMLNPDLAPRPSQMGASGAGFRMPAPPPPAPRPSSHHAAPPPPAAPSHYGVPLTPSAHIPPPAPVPLPPVPAAPQHGSVLPPSSHMAPPRAPSHHAAPLPASRSPRLPGRNSYRGEAVPPGPANPVMSPAYGPPVYPDDAPRPLMGPMGFLALGATVAIACYLLVTILIH